MEELSAEEMMASVSDVGTGQDAPTKTEGETTSTVAKDATVSEAPAFDPKALKYLLEGGKEVIEPWETVQKRAALGYHYAQRAAELNQKESQYKTIEQQNKELQKWKAYDDYARENKAWAEHVTQAWDKRELVGQEQQEQPPAYVDKILAELGELKQFKQSLVDEKTKVQIAHEDKSFSDEITESAKKFNVDLSQANEKGESLEWRVLNHMKSLGLDGTKKGHFTAALKDYYFDNLLQTKTQDAKEAKAKEAQNLRKQGLLGVSLTPKSGKLSSEHIGQRSWDDLANMALADLNNPI